MPRSRRTGRFKTKPVTATQKAYLAAFEQWLREPTQRNLEMREIALRNLLK